MTRLAVLRHAATEWNAAGRLQGRADMPLSAAGRAELAGRRLPDELAGFVWVASPLARAVETARLLGGRPTIEPRLIEMDWGGYEGSTLAELRARHGAAFAANEALGLDLRPPGGESPREVQERLKPWLIELAASGRDTVAVTHKGVIRALLALATGWEMRGKPPFRLDWRRLHLFTVGPGGRLALARCNLKLAIA
jgi:probable phosphoglycerate mutase